MLGQRKPKEADTQKLSQALSGARKGFFSSLFGRKAALDPAFFDQLEESLIAADCGADAAQSLTDCLRKKSRGLQEEEALSMLEQAVAKNLSPLEPPPLAGEKPLAVVLAGVNGAGKTTTIAKLVHLFQEEGKGVLLAASDTFRAAAQDQLQVWGKRLGAPVVGMGQGNPKAVAFDATRAALDQGADVLLVDTAGRLPTQEHLMRELEGIKKSVEKALGRPCVSWLVVDGTTGGNAISQVKAFDAVLGLSGIIVTKLDGTAKGGFLLRLAKEHPVPVLFCGVGEKASDLVPFEAQAFAHALVFPEE